VDKPAVTNASPIVFFSRGKQMDLLRHIDNRIFVPEPVANKILKKGPEDVTAKALQTLHGLKLYPLSLCRRVFLTGDWVLESHLFLHLQVTIQGQKPSLTILPAAGVLHI